MSHSTEKQSGKRLAPDSSPQKKKPEKRHGKNNKYKVLKGIYIGLTVIAAIIVGLFLFWHFFSAPPDMSGTLKPSVTTQVDENGNLIEVEMPGVPQGRKEQVYTFLLVGQDTVGGGNTDTMMLGTYDVPNQKLSVMSLPRDTFVNYRGSTVLLNSVFNWAGGARDTEKGITALKKEIGELTGIVPDFHVLVQWDAVGQLVEAIDGVEFDVPCRMDYYDFTQDLLIDLQPGMQHLNGSEAMQLIRWRHNNDGSGYLTGDLGRIQTQQNFMKAIIAKCLKPDVLLPNLAEYIRIFQDNVITDLSASNMAYFAKSAVGKLSMDSVSFVTLPNKNAGDGAHLLPIGGQIVELVNESFNPYLEEISLYDLDLVTHIVLPTPEPDESEDPTESPDPEATEDPLLPPESSVEPGESPEPAESGQPQESGMPEPVPSAASTEAPVPTPPPVPTAVPEPVPEPEAPAEGEDDVVLPPGV